MTARLVACTRCRAPLPPAGYNAPHLGTCACGARWQVAVFPAALRTPGRGAAAETVQVEGDAGCFFHPAKKAVVPCARCGRFLCAVCDVEFGGEHVCPGCLESGRKKGRIQQLETERTLYDSAALALAALPMILMWPLTFLSAPIALYLGLRYWNAPSSLVPRTRWRAVVAILLALLQIGGWVVLVVTLVNR